MPKKQAANAPQDVDVATDAPLPPLGVKVSVGPLNSLSKVRLEASRLYRAARQGHILASDASKLSSVLSLVARMVEVSDTERRLEALEAARKGGPDD